MYCITHLLYVCAFCVYFSQSVYICVRVCLCVSLCVYVCVCGSPRTFGTYVGGRSLECSQIQICRLCYFGPSLFGSPPFGKIQKATTSQVFCVYWLRNCFITPFFKRYQQLLFLNLAEPTAIGESIDNVLECILADRREFPPWGNFFFFIICEFFYILRILHAHFFIFFFHTIQLSSRFLQCKIL